MVAHQQVLCKSIIKVPVLFMCSCCCHHILQGPILQQHEGIDMAGGFAVPACDERPGNMTQQDFSRYLSPKLHALQQLRLDPCSPCAMHPPELPTAGLDKLQHLLSSVQEPALCRQLDRALHQLLEVGCSVRLLRMAYVMTDPRNHCRWLAVSCLDDDTSLALMCLCLCIPLC